MEIHSLKVTLSEQDLNGLLQRHVPRDQPVEDLTVRLAPEGVYVKGVYPLFINVSFETLWALAAQGGKITARLAQLKAMGMPGNVFKSALLKVIADATRTEEWMTIAGDTVVIDVERMLEEHGVVGRTNLRSVTCQEGNLVLEAKAGVA
jgi:hypothetical protein